MRCEGLKSLWGSGLLILTSGTGVLTFSHAFWGLCTILFGEKKNNLILEIVGKLQIFFSSNTYSL